MSVNKIAGRYAKSLLDLSLEMNKQEVVFKDISIFNQNLNSTRELFLLFKSPIVNPDKKLKIIDQIYTNKFDELTANFFKLIVKKRRESYLPEIAQAFLEQYKAHKNIATAKLTTASEPGPALIEQVKAMIKTNSQADSIELEIEIDPTVIGGFVLVFGDKRYDASIASKFSTIEKDFSVNKYIKKY